MVSPAYTALGYQISAEFPLSLSPIAAGGAVSSFPTLHVSLQESSDRFQVGTRQLHARIARQTPEHPSIEVFTDGDEWSLLCEHGDRYALYEARGDSVLRVRYRGFISVADLAAPLEGPALGMALRLEGAHLLHASSLRVLGRGVAFSGISGQGKSTLAAALLKHGAEFWGDDILRMDAHAPAAFPDGRAARLYEQAAVAAALDVTQAPAAHLGSDKRRLDLSDARFLHQAHSLDALFVLDRRHAGDTLVCEQLRGVEAVMALMYSRYPTWMKSPILDARDFDRLARLAEQVPVFRLALPDGLEHLDRVCEDLLEQITALA